MSSLRPALDSALSAFLASQDLDELTRSLMSARAAALVGGGEELVGRVFAAQLSSTSSQRAECLSFALGSLVVRGVLSMAELAEGLRLQLARLPDTQLDAPHAPALLGSLLAHLTQDEVLADALLLASPGDSAPAAAARATARELLTSPLPSPLAQLRAIYREITEAYFECGDVGALEAALAGLQARHTTHELVRKVVQRSLASGGGEVCELASDLLQRISESQFLPRHSAVEGFLRLLRSSADFAADAPAAAALIPRFTARAIADGVLPPHFLVTAEAVLRGGGTALASPPLSPPRRQHFPSREAVRSGDGGWRAGGAGEAGAASSGAPSQSAASPCAVRAEVEEGEDAVAARMRAAALEAVSVAGALLEGGGARGSGGAGAAPGEQAPLHLRLAGVWGHSGAPLRELRRGALAAVAAALAAPGEPAAAAEALVGALVALAPAGALAAEALQAEVALALISGGAGGGRPGPPPPRAAEAARAALSLALARGALRPQPAARAAARFLQALEDAAEGGEEEGGLLAQGGDAPLELPRYLRGVFEALRAAGARSLDFLAHPSNTLSALLRE